MRPWEQSVVASLSRSDPLALMGRKEITPSISHQRPWGWRSDWPITPHHEPGQRTFRPRLFSFSRSWISGRFLLDCPWTTPPSEPCTHTHSSIQRDPIRPFHMVAPHAMEALPRPIHNQANCHVKSNNGQDPKSNIFSCKREKGVGGKEREKKSTTANLTKLASNKFLSVHFRCRWGVGSPD